MADLAGYQLWLAKQQHQYLFINNYWCAMLAYDMTDNNSSESFKIPYFIVEEELLKENNNVNLENQKDAYISNALRHWLVHLLNEFNKETNVTNYEEVLRDFFQQVDNILPSGVSNPLSPSTSFHNLPTECKLWILYTLRNHGKSNKRSLRTITKDQLGNTYHIVPDCRLYVRITRTENNPPIDYENVKYHPWGSLYRFVLSQPCILLCENENQWDPVWKAFMSFKLNNLYYAIRPTMTVELSKLNAVIMMRDGLRLDFEETMSKMAPVQKAPKKKRQKKKKVAVASAVIISEVDALKIDIEAVIVNDPLVSNILLPTPTEVKPKPQSNKSSEKCWQFPQCPLENTCPYVHPKFPCSKFPNCPHGWKCIWLHEFCPNDANCAEPNCAYEHINSTPTYHRIPRQPITASPRPVASVTALARNVSEQSTPQTAEDASRPASTPVTRQYISTSDQRKMRCQYFPQCKKNPCTYIHPTLKCRKFAEGKKCGGRYCFGLHGICPKDGSCDDWKCVYEHEKSLPIFLRKRSTQSATTNQSKGTLSRANSVSNLSTCSGRSYRSRKSVTFEDDSDTDSLVSANTKKNSTDLKPVGILRPPGGQTRASRSGASCTKQGCKLSHIVKKCPVFPRCPNGGLCIFEHELCANDGVCSKENCDYKHILLHPISKKWCTSGSRCKRVGCWFIHPKECVGRCPTPDDCWMYHNPAPARPPTGPGKRSGFAPGPGFPVEPGYLPMPPFLPRPAGINYGYGPDFGYRPGPVFPPGPGYGFAPAPHMGPGGFWQAPDFPPGGYGLRPGEPPRAAPPRSTGPSSPPPYTGLSAAERERLAAKARDSTRL
ncbi:hypothetical protein PENTCL1PPCAC_1272 [Pristionchus entomophagus]|uniref:Zinc finger CCCH domain-containing protein 14 n=1 Tax=Pristionchus entomophagus TaxID=358040 RepID=A0AAV5S9X5_9BILA|nr:hypothetical protein PENTCL1PPCAC_1272 [Pristionchus entomophagus]